MTQFPLRFIKAISPLITPIGAMTLVGFIAIGILYVIRTNPSPNTLQTLTIDPSLVVAAANRVLGDIAELNKIRGPIKFSYTVPKGGDLKHYHRVEINDRIKRDKDAAIASLHQKIAQHLEGMSVIILPPEHLNWGFKTYGDPTRTFYTFCQNLQDSKTKKVIARSIFNINQTDKSTFPRFSSSVNGIIESEIVIDPFQVVA